MSNKTPMQNHRPSCTEPDGTCDCPMDSEQPAPAGSALDHGPLRRSFTRDEILSYCKTWMKANSLDVGCSREYYVTNLGLLVDFATDLFDGQNTELRHGDALKPNTEVRHGGPGDSK